MRPDAISRAGVTEDPPPGRPTSGRRNRADAATRGRHRSPWRVLQPATPPTVTRLTVLRPSRGRRGRLLAPLRNRVRRVLPLRKPLYRGVTKRLAWSAVR